MLGLALAGTLGAGIVAGSVLSTGGASMVRADANDVAPQGHHRDHRKDLRIIFISGKHLRIAAKVLGRGEAEYGGHRVAAIHLIEQARGELKEAAEFVRAHHHH